MAADGTGRDQERRSEVQWAKLKAQRDEARAERDLLHAALSGLVKLREGPHSVHYQAALERAWEIARQALLK